MHKIVDNLAEVRGLIQDAARNHKRDPQNVALLAVSKTQTAEIIAEAYGSGQKTFGENYLQEALDKIAALAHLDICWHFIGPIQSNKTRAISENFAWVHTLDRLKIAQRLNAQRPECMIPLNVCIQVNIDDEPSKAGVAPTDLVPLAQRIAAMDKLHLRGLMAIPMHHDQHNSDNSAFMRMRKLFETLKATGDFAHWDTLSMGMSDDFDDAIANGASIVRIGSAIFGARKK
ncbi:MAG: pyridoxal phosphate enzyme (YggS family) [Lentisphaeria bacterium]|jgi:pyridoxal phosphate enzyme (YggS family)